MEKDIECHWYKKLTTFLMMIGMLVVYHLNFAPETRTPDTGGGGTDPVPDKVQSLEFYDSTNIFTNTITNPTASESITWNLPDTNGSDDEFLVTDGAGNLSWGERRTLVLERGVEYGKVTNTWSEVTWNTVKHNTLGTDFWQVGDDHTITINETGTYAISCLIWFANTNGNTGQRGVRINLSDSTIYQNRVAGLELFSGTDKGFYNGNRIPGDTSAIVYMTAGTTFSCQGYHSSGSDISFGTETGLRNSLTVTKL